MAKVVISHKVKDYDSWRPLFDADLAKKMEEGDVISKPEILVLNPV